jgi:hypothetical protein
MNTIQTTHTTQGRHYKVTECPRNYFELHCADMYQDHGKVARLAINEFGDIGIQWMDEDFEKMDSWHRTEVIWATLQHSRYSRLGLHK